MAYSTAGIDVHRRNVGRGCGRRRRRTNHANASGPERLSSRATRSNVPCCRICRSADAAQVSVGGSPSRALVFVTSCPYKGAILLNPFDIPSSVSG
jgi:hypothetical protein